MLLLKILPPISAILSFTYADDSISDSDYAAIVGLQKSNFGTKLGPTCACSILTDLFEDKVFRPGTEVHIAEATHYWDSRGSASPQCVFVPSSANDIAKAVVALNACQSPFAIRGGGHMPVAGAANTEGGVLIALSSFKDIKVSADEKSVDAGPGVDWYELYSTIEPNGLIVAGGRLKTIGVSGLTLGGGISYFTSRYGFTMDNVLAYEIVTASGKVLTATANKNEDLFWALKGGGNNFGVVTKFTFAAYRAPKVSTAFQMHTEEVAVDYITAVANFANYHETIDIDAGGIFVLGNSPSPNKLHATAAGVTIRFMGVQIGESEKPTVFQNFTSIPSVYSAYGVSSLAEWVLPLDSGYQQGREIFGMHSMLVNEASLQEMWKTFKAASDEMGHIEELYSTLALQPIAMSASSVAKTNGIGNTWDIDNSKPYIYWVISTHWQNVEDDEEVMAWHTNLLEKLHAANVEKGIGLDFMYFNDCSDGQDAFSGLPPASLERLKEIRKKYDPTLVFTKLVSGGFKLDGGKKPGYSAKDEL